MRTTLFALLAVAAGCATATVPGRDDSCVGIPWSISIPAGEVRSVDDERLFIELVSVENDSRCAEGAQCVWEGDATAVLSVWEEEGSPERVELHTSSRFSSSAIVGDYAIELTGIEPHPRDGVRIQTGEYVATVEVSR